ncbi:hypothetical protein DPMN_056889 [Dreissena polymorpha]|uniref:Peptidase M12B domain-containing protein n=1 Tax=Dreissena polymorpha TaxID=45954 RepID=A0A9D4CSJ5_DREPO|nr:hypothetical protein DPMN_056889 [Dreissena polymorpha]
MVIFCGCMPVHAFSFSVNFLSQLYCCRLDLLGEDGSSGLLGYAYVGTVCVNTNYKYSINEYSASNVAWVASHELGHA